MVRFFLAACIAAPRLIRAHWPNLPPAVRFVILCLIALFVGYRIGQNWPW